jgi:ABC-2 type transport system permease protein
MKKSLTIAKWEFLEKARTKAFILSLIITPVIIFVFSYLPGKLAQQEDTETKAIGILDSTQTFYTELSEKISSSKFPDGQPRYVVMNLFSNDKKVSEIKTEANSKVLKGDIDSYIYIYSESNDSIKLEYRSKTIGNFRDMDRFEESFNQVRREIEFAKANIDPELVKRISKDINIKSIKVEETGKESKTDFFGKFISSYIFIFLLMISILGTGGMLIRSLVEEKSNRLMEILVSSCKPNDLLLGKVFGLSFLAIFQVVVWILLAIAFMGPMAMAYINLDSIFIMLLYFILGFMFYTSIFVGLGSIVTTEQEAQQLTSYLSLVILLPIVVAMPAMQNPDLLIVKIFSFIPLTTPAIMLLRINSVPVPLWEIAVTTALLIVSIYLTVLFSAKVFRIGILSYGKRPSFKEVMKWLKSS